VRLSGRAVLLLACLTGLAAVFATDQILPARTEYLAEMRVWLAARATGLVAYALLTILVSLGMVLSHPINKSTWKLSKTLFPWHENLFVFVVAFIGVHIISLVIDPYAGVGLDGAFIPGLSSYRSVPVALGTMSLYALLVAGLTARYTKFLPSGWWLILHCFSLVAWGLGWVHGILAGTDTEAFRAVYVASGLIVLASASYRYWVGKQKRPTFASSLPDATEPTSRPSRELPPRPMGSPSPRPLPPRPAPGLATVPAAVPAAQPARRVLAKIDARSTSLINPTPTAERPLS
jgi:hypothetical protein